MLYYDCTNYFFEIEQEEGLKQYGPSKDHKPNPIVQMGLFMDGDGIPLAFSINKGNTNEQLTLKPLEQKILSDFELSRFIVCTDAGLASQDNRKFNNKGERAFITTQSIKKLKAHLRKWALDPKGWSLTDDGRTYDITELDEEKDNDKVFYKERWIKDGFYAVCTNLEDDASSIIRVNRRRWEIEECFRILKNEFRARPVYLSRDDRIEAHFMTCFIALVIYRLLEKKLNDKYTCHEIINGLRNMNFLEIKGDGYIPTYTRTDFTDDLHEAFGFRTDYQIVNTRQMKKIFKITKS